MHSPHRKSFGFIWKALHHFYLFTLIKQYFHFNAHENVKFSMTQTQR